MVLTAAAVMTAVGTAIADVSRTHVLNAHWPGHARFHTVSGIGTITGSQLLALWLLWRRPADDTQRDLAVTVAAALPVLAWAPNFAAYLVPGTTIGDDPEHLPTVGPVPAPLIPAAVFPAVCAAGYALHRRGH